MSKPDTAARATVTVATGVPAVAPAGSARPAPATPGIPPAPPGPAPTPHGDARRRRIDGLLRHSPLQPVFRALSSRRLAVLAYHGIDDPAGFAAQMERLVRTATPVSLATLARCVAEQRPLPPRSVLVTFDDGDHSVLTQGLPVLTRLRIPAAAFVVTELIGTDQPFWWSEAAFLAAQGGTAGPLAGCPPQGAVARLKTLPDADRRRSLHELRATARAQAPRRRQLDRTDLGELRTAGVEIGNHTHTHPCLDRCADSTAREEVAEAHRLLTWWLGEPPTAFAYPNGNRDARTEALLGELGYRLGFLFNHRHDALLPPDPLRINRLRVNSDTTPHRFDTILSGLHPAVHRIRGGC
ncbi:polysaccharide deacetylase family protein [Kitasatospora sp. NPDC048540]|uniref:polysaccharide deacetylase family protein n=1 Tax=unclassified Kitasatospora TaxID=2633591 RepID=UPI000AAF3D95|nr:polysaccharide deacetylase family protein [Kitasatospora sp. MBT63]